MFFLETGRQTCSFVGTKRLHRKPPHFICTTLCGLNLQAKAAVAREIFGLMSMDPRLSYILFNMIDGLGPVKVRALTEHFGSPEDVLDASEQDLQQVQGIGRELASRITTQREEKDPAEELSRAEAMGLHIVTAIDAHYPQSLLNIYDPPLALYVKGTLEAGDRHAVAVVGSRKVSHYGQTACDRLSYQLAKAGCTVVSGLARGIDTTAHKAALKAGGRTLAVIGSAHDKLYPPENEELAEKIAKSGAVLSEYPLGREADRATFPYRNRIVSGLSLGVLVVEAPVKSGSLITADAAMEQGRLVFAIPGRIDQSGARGCHRLIKQGAKLVEEVDDILDEFEYFSSSLPLEEQAEFVLPFDVTKEESLIIQALEEGELDVDTLSRRAGLAVTQVSSMLLGLEMKKAIRMLPGRLVALNRGN
jgi:DNA processing protein